MPDGQGRSPTNTARRHFIGLAAAAGARLAALAAFSATVTLSAAAKEAGKRGSDLGLGRGRDGVGKGGPLCLLRGTAILTSKGETAIQELGIGNLVKTVRGELLPVKGSNG